MPIKHGKNYPKLLIRILKLKVVKLGKIPVVVPYIGQKLNLKNHSQRFISSLGQQHLGLYLPTPL